MLFLPPIGRCTVFRAIMVTLATKQFEVILCFLTIALKSSSEIPEQSGEGVYLKKIK